MSHENGKKEAQFLVLIAIINLDFLPKNCMEFFSLYIYTYIHTYIYIYMFFSNTEFNELKGSVNLSIFHWTTEVITYKYLICASLITQLVKNLPAMQETPVRFLGEEDPLEKGKATQSSILACRISWNTVHGVAKSWTWLSNFLSIYI